MRMCEREIQLAPEGYRQYWIFFQKGMCAHYYGDKWEEIKFHDVRMSWTESGNEATRLKGEGYIDGLRCAQKSLGYTKKGRPSPGGSLNHICVVPEIIDDIKLISKATGTTTQEVRKSAYLWYCRVKGGELGLKMKSNRKDVLIKSANENIVY